jgi:thiamine biosynthesis lipoprotein
MKSTRRQFVVAAFAAGILGSAGAIIATGDRKPAFMWRGAALGGEARVALYGPDPEAASGALAAVAAEIERLEAIFSLHRETSELARLNRDGHLAAPSRDLVELLRSAVAWRGRTNGAFDPTVQPLWLAAAAGKPVSPAMIAKVGTHVDPRIG